MQSNQFRSSVGFTMMELLTALAIIALLVGITMSVVVHVRESGRQSVCLSNLKQLGQAFHLYLQDYDGTYPPAVGDSLDRSAWVAMPEPFIRLDRPAQPENGSIYPYVRNSEVYMCPSDPLGRQIRLSYGMNIELGTNPEIIPNARESQIYNPSGVVLLMERPFNPFYNSPAFAVNGRRCFMPTQSVPCYPEEICGEPYFPCGCLGQLACRHSGRSTNLLFCDGHARSFPSGGVKLGMFFPYRTNDD